VYGEPLVWRVLRLGEPPDDRPLYVGKSESSFQSRDLDDHFGDGRTGRSTLRRTFAGLLSVQLQLVPIPRGRNPLDRTERASMYALPPDGDARLTEWMHHNLTISLWPCRVIDGLRTFENDVIAALKPPLCLDGKWKPNGWHAEIIRPAKDAMTAIVRSAP
jgi:hypothetical protein